MEKVIIGIDLGGTNMRLGAVTKDHTVLSPLMLKSSIIAEAKEPVNMLCKVIQDYCMDYQIQNIEAISIGVPSSVKNDKETIIYTTNIRNEKGEAVFQNENIATKLQKCFKVPIFVNNDVNNILLYDIVENHLEDNKVVVGIYIGTGVGAAVYMNGQLMEGKNGAELDIGHIPYYNGDEPCSCGKKGCCECYASGWKLQKIRKEYYPTTEIKDMFTLHREAPVMKEFVKASAYVYAVMATIFNPDSLIVGGGVPEMKDFPREEFEKLVNIHTGTDVMKSGFDYVYSKDCVLRGIIGAAIFAESRLK